MNNNQLPPSLIGRKQEDMGDDKGDKKPVVKTLNRVPRACNACRKQKMRCEGADNPPCRRCKNTGLECLFEKPSREATLTGEAGLERIRALESHVIEIRHSQHLIQGMLADIQAQLRGGPLPARSPSLHPPGQPYHQSPSLHSPSVATPPGTHPRDGPSANAYPAQPRSQHRPSSSAPYPIPHGSQLSPTDSYSSTSGPQQHLYSNAAPGFQAPPGTHSLPPFSSLQSMAVSGAQQGNLSSIRFNTNDNGSRSAPHRQHNNNKRVPSSNVTSADSSGAEDDGLPASGLFAPWEVLRGLADVAVEQAAKENGESSDQPSRPITPIGDRQGRPAKRRKIHHRQQARINFPDIVTKGIVSEGDARELFRIFYHGCSTFLPVFDANHDTFEALHERSPFAVDGICMVAARVRDGGGKPSEVHRNCLDEVQAISCASLFSPVQKVEAVQAMILVSGWSDNGWLSGGHAVRMALELSLHQSWPKLLRRMSTNPANDPERDRELVVGARTWFCLYLFEHQLSYGTGRPAILKDDESIANARIFLQHPLAIEDDMRLVSTVELMALRERVHNIMSPIGVAVNDRDFEELRRADIGFRSWYATWDAAFSQKYEDAAFYRQSLQIQHFHAELFHNATALRGINGPDDVDKMPPQQRELAIRTIHIARKSLEIAVNSPSYCEGMKYAVHYTHATVTFAASLLLRLARLFPSECNVEDIRTQIGRLAQMMSELPGKRYALTLQVMLNRSRKRKSASSSRSPKTSRDHHRSSMSIDHSSMSYSPVYDQPPYHHPSDHAPAPQHLMLPPHGQLPGQQQHHYPPDAEHIWRGFEATSNEQLPVWISDQTLGGNSFSQNGMDAFLLPPDYLPSAPQIW